MIAFASTAMSRKCAVSFRLRGSAFTYGSSRTLSFQNLSKRLPMVARLCALSRWLMPLRDYQQAIIDKARRALTRHKRVLIQAPTGAGKTVLASFIMQSVAERGQRGFFICHRRELIDQTSGTFAKFGIPHSFIAAGYSHDPTRLVRYAASIRSEPLGKVTRPDLCIWDEAHHLAAGGWARVHDCYSDAFHVGLSATPNARRARVAPLVRYDGAWADCV